MGPGCQLTLALRCIDEELWRLSCEDPGTSGHPCLCFSSCFPVIRIAPFAFPPQGISDLWSRSNLTCPVCDKRGIRVVRPLPQALYSHTNRTRGLSPAIWSSSPSTPPAFTPSSSPPPSAKSICTFLSPPSCVMQHCRHLAVRRGKKSLDGPEMPRPDKMDLTWEEALELLAGEVAGWSGGRLDAAVQGGRSKQCQKRKEQYCVGSIGTRALQSTSWLIRSDQCVNVSLPQLCKSSSALPILFLPQSLPPGLLSFLGPSASLISSSNHSFLVHTTLPASLGF